MPVVLTAPSAHTAVPGPVTGSPLTRFVGRDAEIAALLGAVRRTRLLSLVGPGGSGKTRLAYAVRDRLAGSGQRTWWVPLGQLDRPALLVSAVADALQVVEVPGRSLRDTVVGRVP